MWRVVQFKTLHTYMSTFVGYYEIIWFKYRIEWDKIPSPNPVSNIQWKKFSKDSDIYTFFRIILFQKNNVG